MQKARILLIEDTDTVREVLTRQLEALGVSVTALSDGDGVKRELDKNIYDLVIADLHLPNCSGFDIARFANAKNCKVILLSGDYVATSRDDFMTAQFEQILTKPVSMQSLKQMLVQHELIEPETISIAYTNTNHLHMASIDLPALEEQMGQLDAIALQMLERFPDMMRPLVQYIITDARNNNLKRLADTAHSLKSAARSAGALALGQISENIQTAALRHIVNPNQIQLLLSEFESVEREINELCHKELVMA